MSGAAPLHAAGVLVRLGGRAVVDRVDLALRPGEVTAIVGPNGAGKSTLLACLAGLRRPQAGEVRLGPDALLELPARERARRIGFLPQTPEVAWRLDVETLVGLGRTPHAGLFGTDPHSRAAVARAMAAADLGDLAQRDIASLSGGERGRVLIARALAGEPGWLIADEPLTGLDLGHQLDISRLLRRFADDAGGVVVTVHDLGFAARTADRAVVMAQGRVLADGPPQAAMRPQVLASAYGVEARWVGAPGAPVLEVVGRTTGFTHG